MSKVELDATAGFRLMWLGKETRQIVFIDKRVACRPDVVCDARQLPFKDGSFRRIYFDPPHMIITKTPRIYSPISDEVHRFGINRLSTLINKFGYFKTRTEMVNYLYHTNREFLRTLNRDGTVLCKTTDGDGRNCLSLRQIKQMFGFDFAIYRTKEEIRNPNHREPNSWNKVVWLLMIPRLKGDPLHV